MRRSREIERIAGMRRAITSQIEAESGEDGKSEDTDEATKEPGNY